MQHPILEHQLVDLEDGKGFNYKIRWSDRPDLVAKLHFNELSECVGKHGGFKEAVDALRVVYLEAGVYFRDPIRKEK